jgi:hypothetical protein
MMVWSNAGSDGSLRREMRELLRLTPVVFHIGAPCFSVLLVGRDARSIFRWLIVTGMRIGMKCLSECSGCCLDKSGHVLIRKA